MKRPRVTRPHAFADCDFRFLARASILLLSFAISACGDQRAQSRQGDAPAQSQSAQDAPRRPIPGDEIYDMIMGMAQLFDPLTSDIIVKTLGPYDFKSVQPWNGVVLLGGYRRDDADVEILFDGHSQLNRFQMARKNTNRQDAAKTLELGRGVKQKSSPEMLKRLAGRYGRDSHPRRIESALRALSTEMPAMDPDSLRYIFSHVRGIRLDTPALPTAPLAMLDAWETRFQALLAAAGPIGGTSNADPRGGYASDYIDVPRALIDIVQRFEEVLARYQEGAVQHYKSRLDLSEEALLDVGPVLYANGDFDSDGSTPMQPELRASARGTSTGPGVPSWWTDGSIVFAEGSGQQLYDVVDGKLHARKGPHPLALVPRGDSRSDEPTEGVFVPIEQELVRLEQARAAYPALTQKEQSVVAMKARQVIETSRKMLAEWERATFLPRLRNLRMRDAAQDYRTNFHAELMETADGERTMAEPPPGWLRLRQDGTMHLLVQYGRKLVERKGTWGVADATFAGMREPSFRIKYELSGRPDHVLGSSGVLEFRWGGEITREVDGVTRRFARLDTFGENEARRGAEVLARTGESGSGPASGPGGGSRDPQGADPKTKPDSSQFSLPGTYVVAEESADALASKSGRKRSYELTLQKGGKFSIVYKDGSRTTRTTGTWEQEGDEIGLRATHVNGKPISTPKSTTISIQDDGTLLMDDVVLERK